MAEHEPQPPEPSLRQQALERLANAPQTLRDLSRTEILQLAHELQVHQIELELQNEELKSTLAELERARSLFFSLFNRSPIGYVLLDEQGIIREVNQTFCEMVTYRMDEVVGKPLQNFLHEDDRSAFLARYRATFRQPQNKVFELRLNGAEQQVLWVRVQGERLLLPAEQAGKDDRDRLLLAYSDITAQKIAEENRRLDERRLQSLIEIAQYPYSSVEELLRFTLEKALLVTQSEIGYLLDYNEETQQLRTRFVSEGAQKLSELDPAAYPQTYSLEESGLRAEAIRQRKAVIINDYRQPHPNKRGYPEGHVEIRRFLSVPVFEDGCIVAVISVANKPHDYTETDAQQLTLMMDTAWKMVVRQKLIEALQRSEERYRNLVENAQDFIYRFSFVPQAHYEYVSPSVTTVTGYTPEELYQNAALGLELVHPEDVPYLQEMLAEGVKEDKKLLLRWRRKDGRVIWVEQQYTPLFDSQGNLTAFEAIARDITDRKEIELALQNLLQEYETLFNGVQDAVFLIEVGEEGEFRYLRTNLSHQKKTGFPLETVQGKTPLALLGEELGAIIRGNYQRCVDSGHPITYEETLDLPGGIRTWSTTLVPIWREGCIQYIVGAATDITEAKAAQEAVRQGEERYRTLFENMSEGFALHEMIWDEAGRPVDYRFLEVNPAFERLSGLRADQVIGRTARQLLPDLEQSWIERYAEIARTGKALVFEEYAAPLKKWYDVRAFSPKAGFFAAVFSDVTQRKQWEKEREQLIQDLQSKNNELSQFTYTVSHDLKGPLITILGFLGFVEQNLEQGNLEQAKADLQRIRFAAEKMQALLEGLLELSRIGRLINPPSQFSFGEVVTEAVQLLLGNIYDQGRTVEFEIAPDLPNVYGDRARLLQVMQNLLDNALKYLGEQPQPLIEIGWREAADEYQFYVRDNGIGIEPAHQERVFGLFEKLDPRAQGYGVGLALVKRIIEVHHGRIWVESEGEGKGATFWFTLPKAPKA